MPGADKIDPQLTCASWLPVVESHLPTELIAAESRRRLQIVASQLPGDGLAALEVRLAADSPRVDLSLRLRDAEHAAALTERLSVPRLEGFLARWSQRVSQFDPIRSLWLELDLDRSPRGLLDPVICVELSESIKTDWLLDVLLPALTGRRSETCQRRLIERCLDAVPASGRLLYVFDLGSRRVDAIRLELKSSEPASIIDGLKPVVPKELGQRMISMATLLQGCDDYHLSLDAGREISPRIGLEASFQRLPHREPGWSRLIDRLVVRGLCTQAKRDALLAWPGWDSPHTTPDVWPVAVRRPGIFCARCLSHIKLVSRPVEEPEAKAYLLFQPLDKRPTTVASLSSVARS